MNHRSLSRVVLPVVLLLLALSACGGAPQAAAPTAAPTAPSAPTAPATAAPTELPATAAPTDAPTTAAPTAAPSAAAQVPLAGDYPEIAITNKPEKVRIGYQVIPNAELLAKHLGWYEQVLGVPIEWKQFESGRDVNTAIAAGGIDIGLVGSSPAANGISQDLPYDVIAIYDVIGNAEALAARAPIASIAELKGKKIGAPFGSTTHYSLLQILQLNGIKPDEVTLLDLNPSDLLAAWTRGDIDAAYVWQPTLQKLYDSGGTKLIGSDEVAAKGFPTFDLAVATRDFSDKYPEVVAAYVQTLSRAVELYRANPEQATAYIAEELSITPDEAKAQIEGLIWLTAEEQLADTYFGTVDKPGALGQALKTTADFLLAQQVIRSTPELPAFQQAANPRFLQLAVGK
ncbi:MAG: aliphatic sulfonate ABC transporter substrate-binding protein [Chloroflexales bacterium]|nr:aliphatic sulfonate ABC transporter substrate-binding protein [Chloroflexales bacterium]